jgi:hypothetical protein
MSVVATLERFAATIPQRAYREFEACAGGLPADEVRGPLARGHEQRGGLGDVVGDVD